VTIVFYISGHGLGHASRDIEVINAILRKRPDARIVVRTAAPLWFFETFVRGSIEVQVVDVDTGVSQVDSLRLDERDTALRARAFYSTFAARVEAEAITLAALAPAAVVADLPPLGIAAAARSGVPAVALGNFTWDWIYAGYDDFERLAPGVIDSIGQAYALATRALRLPFHGGFESMHDAVSDIPLIARHGADRPQEIRRRLRLAAEVVVVLASFGGYGLELPYDDIARANGFTLVVTNLEGSRAAPRPMPHTGAVSHGTGELRSYNIDALARDGLYYPDLVAAADVVVSKPGYGIVSECIANHTALLYTERGRFPEHDVFVAEMPRVLRCRFIPHEDLLAGRWQPAVDGLLHQASPAEPVDTSGADVAADAILEIADGADARTSTRRTS
jgi:L-arabinokinase